MFGRLDVEETADADHAAEVTGRDPAQLAVALPPEVGRTLEVDLAEPDAPERVEHDRFHALDLGVEPVVARSSFGRALDAPNISRAARVVERRAAARERPADHLHAEALARGEVERRVDVVEPADVEVRASPHTRLQRRRARFGRRP